jgi:CDP-diacylglycerol--serine O-phosphatidyltransferase
VKVPKTIFPSFVTVGNMFCGYMAVIFALVNHDLVWSAWMILLAAFLDTMDGKVARLTNSSSQFGVEYDSLADVVSFGFAPSILIYTFFFKEWNMVGLFISFFPLLFGSIRLARFNTKLIGFDKEHFVGLPIPASALSIAGYVILLDAYFPGKIYPRLLLLLTLVVSVLMVSNIRYEKFPVPGFRGTLKRKLISVLILIVAVAIAIEPQLLILPFIGLYVLSGPVVHLFRSANKGEK